jgi:hypothetical protein
VKVIVIWDNRTRGEAASIGAARAFDDGLASQGT